MARKARFTARLNVPIQASLREALDDLAERNDRLVSDEVRAAITYHLRKADEQDPYLAVPAQREPMDRQLAVVVKQQAREGLESLAMKHGRTVAAEVRLAVQRYLERTGVDLVDADPQLALLTA